jgi:colanic acid/amylovoran biosynthesis glycosyltransferase
MIKIAYITVNMPFGSKETFILTELLSIKELGFDILIIPRDVSINLFHKTAEPLLNNTISLPWLNRKIVWEFLRHLIIHPSSFLRIMINISFKARNLRIFIKNLIIFPKAIYTAKIIRALSISHIHAHWASTTSTMAYIVSNVTGIPWSFTAHRWDIKENNLLKEKCKTASFVRAISEKGRREIMEAVKDKSLADKIFVIHMSVNIPAFYESPNVTPDTFTFLCPANLVIVKGHRYLFEACRRLLDKGIKFKCLIAGDGPLKDELIRSVRNLNLMEYIEFSGKLRHEKLLELYMEGKINSVVLPSIITDDGEEEGIPVALMEAMSYGIPVISTNTGGIHELIGDGSGIMVNEKDPEAIANAIEKLIKDASFYESIRNKGREKIEKDFNISITSEKILKLFSA